MSDASDIQSPCVAVCRLDRGTGLCIGCRRTADEIRQWPQADALSRRAILERAAARKSA